MSRTKRKFLIAPWAREVKERMKGRKKSSPPLMNQRSSCVIFHNTAETQSGCFRTWSIDSTVKDYLLKSTSRKLRNISKNSGSVNLGDLNISDPFEGLNTKIQNWNLTAFVKDQNLSFIFGYFKIVVVIMVIMIGLGLVKTSSIDVNASEKLRCIVFANFGGYDILRIISMR